MTNPNNNKINNDKRKIIKLIPIVQPSKSFYMIRFLKLLFYICSIVIVLDTLYAYNVDYNHIISIINIEIFTYVKFHIYDVLQY